MASGLVTLASVIEARAGRADDLHHALSALVEASRAEPGCVTYDLHQDPDDTHRFLFYENWRTEAAFKRHLAKPHIAAFLARWDELLAVPVEMRRWTMLSGLQNQPALSQAEAAL